MPPTTPSVARLSARECVATSARRRFVESFMEFFERELRSHGGALPQERGIERRRMNGKSKSRKIRSLPSYYKNLEAKER